MKDILDHNFPKPKKSLLALVTTKELVDELNGRYERGEEVMGAPFDQGDVELKEGKIDTIRFDLVAFALAVVALVLSLVGIVLAAVAM